MQSAPDGTHGRSGVWGDGARTSGAEPSGHRRQPACPYLCEGTQLRAPVFQGPPLTAARDPLPDPSEGKVSQRLRTREHKAVPQLYRDAPPARRAPEKRGSLGLQIHRARGPAWGSPLWTARTEQAARHPGVLIEGLPGTCAQTSAWGSVDSLGGREEAAPRVLSRLRWPDGRELILCSFTPFFAFHGNFTTPQITENLQHGEDLHPGGADRSHLAEGVSHL